MAVSVQSPILSDLSLMNLANALKDEDVKIFLYLNIPPTTITIFYEECKALNQKHNVFKQRCLLHWKEMKKSVSELIKISLLDWALRQSNHIELADLAKERQSLGLHITEELFSSII